MFMAKCTIPGEPEEGRIPYAQRTYLSLRSPLMVYCVHAEGRSQPPRTGRQVEARIMVTPNWTIITPSRYEWERRALDFIRARFPTHDPYRAWANFEFQTADGAIYEVDLLVLTKQGFWLVEIKSRPGRVAGDTGTWTWTHNGRRFSDDNPVLL